MEVEYQKTALQGGSVLLYELHLKFSHETRWFGRGERKRWSDMWGHGWNVSFEPSLADGGRWLMRGYLAEVMAIFMAHYFQN